MFSIKKIVISINDTAIAGFTKIPMKLIPNPYRIMKAVYTKKNIISVTIAAIAAPLMPYRGINVRFKIMLETAPTPWPNTLEPCMLMEVKVKPEIIFMKRKNKYQHSMLKTIEEDAYSTPYKNNIIFCDNIKIPADTGSPIINIYLKDLS